MSETLKTDIKADRIPDKGLSIDNGPKEQVRPYDAVPTGNKVKRGMKYDPATKTLVPDYGEGVKEPNSGRTWEDMQKEKAKTEIESVAAARIANDLTNKGHDKPNQTVIDTAITKENPIETKNPMDFLKKK